MKSLIKVICSPWLTVVLIVLIAAAAVADEIPAPIEPPTCEYDNRYRCA